MCHCPLFLDGSKHTRQKRFSSMEDNGWKNSHKSKPEHVFQKDEHLLCNIYLFFILSHVQKEGTSKCFCRRYILDKFEDTRGLVRPELSFLHNYSLSEMCCDLKIRIKCYFLAANQINPVEEIKLFFDLL